MSKELDRLMAKMAADGITISTRLANPNQDSPMRRIGEAAERAGIAYGTPPGPRECHEEVSRRGEYQPCDLPAVGYRIDPEEGTSYPVCKRHHRAPFTNEPSEPTKESN